MSTSFTLGASVLFYIVMYGMSELSRWYLYEYGRLVTLSYPLTPLPDEYHFPKQDPPQEVLAEGERCQPVLGRIRPTQT